MSMTREEAIAELESIKQCQVDTRKEIEALDLAITALRPASREQAEKVWRGEWKKNKHAAIENAICSKCKTVFQAYYGNYQFCPHCGVPMTDEAMEMVMERLEALKDGKGVYGEFYPCKPEIFKETYEEVKEGE